ncbi:MAG: hypothetical protein IPM56_19410 [Ignavibacteriales bacterium]|nr:MAG: hypothetical protein IPM56_19410 [Ignavibacteriales bacterium]
MKDIKILSNGFKIFLIFFIPLVLGNSNLMTSDDYEYFYLYNNTTFSPGSDAAVNIYSYSKRNLSFKYRLIRINDVEKFFSAADMNTSRYSFDIWGSNKEILLKHTSLIKEWTGKIKGSDYNYQSINIGKVDEPGIYILQALRGDWTAYCGIVVSDLSLVYKNSGKEILAFAADSKTGKFINDAELKIYGDNKLLQSVYSDDDGLMYVKIENTDVTHPLLIAKTKTETILSDPYFYFNSGRENNSTAYIYTNQPVYRPGQEVFVKAIIRNKNGNEFLNLVNEEFSVSIRSPKNKEVFNQAIKTNEFGTINFDFILDEEADLGDYFITINNSNSSYQGVFSVEEYKKPEYSVKVETGLGSYASGDEITGKVTADYYFGSPVMNAKVKLNIFRKNFWRPWWYWSEYAWFYKNYYRYYGYNEQLIKQIDGEFDGNGEFHFAFDADNNTDADYVYTIKAEVTDQSRRAITGSSEAFVTRGSFSLFTSSEKYLYSPGEKASIRINTADFNDIPVESDFEVFVYFPDKQNSGSSDELFKKLKGRTDRNGKAVISFFTDSGLEGHYRFTVSAVDFKDRRITSSGSFYAGNFYNYYYTKTSYGLEIITDKDSYDKGDSLKAIVFLPHSGMELLLSYESGHIIKYKKVYAENNSFSISEKLDDKFVPGFNISITFFKEKQLYNTSKLIGVLAKDKLLNVELTPSKSEYKPGETAFYNITVKDQLGNPVRDTELSFGIIDESIYAIKEDPAQDIQNFFYAPVFSPVSTMSSNQYNYFSSTSRKATFIDKNFFDKADNDNRNYHGNLSGKVKYINSDEAASNIIVLLSNNERFYSARTDSTGSYSFRNIAEESYEIFVFSGTNGFISAGKVKVKGNFKHNFEVDENVLQINEMTFESDASGFAMSLAPPSPKLEMAGDLKKRSDMEERQKDDYVNAEVRSNFVDALIWLPSVKTNNEGKAIVEFKIPDNLTTWRTTVRGVTKNTSVGQKVNKFISRKDLLVRMETPRFFRKNDELTISTIVHNYLDTKKLVKISFKGENIHLAGSKINSGKTQSEFIPGKNYYEIEINKNSELRIDWNIKVTEPIGNAILIAEALTNEESDAVKLTVPVLPEGIKQIKPLVFDFNDEYKDAEYEFTIPENVDLRTAKFSFNINPSLSGTLLSALNDLAGYPYGCVEQTMSRFLPTLVVANTFKALNVQIKSELLKELPKMVESGLKRLYSFQHSDGGWGWWTNDQTHPYMTAYVVYGLSLAKQAGFYIKDDVIEKGLMNLKSQIQNYSQNDETTLTYMLYSFTKAAAGKSELSDNEKELLRILSKKNLNSYSLSLLIETALLLNEKSIAEELSAKLISMVEEDSNTAHWGGKQWHYNWQEDKVQSTAFSVKALLKTFPENKIIVKAVRWMLQQKHGFSWRSTQETASVIFALTDYLKITNELDPDYTYTVFINNRQVASGDISEKDVYAATKTIRISGEDKFLVKGKNKVRIVKSGKGSLYFSSINEYYSTDYRAAAKSSAFRITKEYYVLSLVQDGDRIVYEKEYFDGYIKSGQEIFVKTFVESKIEDNDYFILEDLLPSGFEVIKNSDDYFIKDEDDYKYYNYYYHRPWRWTYADREVRDEKVAFFVTRTKSQMEFSYIIKAQIPGYYSIPSAQGYLMYYPEMNGVSEPSEIVILDNNE